jgi:predicted phage tail protein
MGLIQFAPPAAEINRLFDEMEVVRVTEIEISQEKAREYKQEVASLKETIKALKVELGVLERQLMRAMQQKP